MKLLFIRHGDPDYTIDSLTEKGWKEAEFLSEKIAALDVRDFYVSPLGRAKDTANLRQRYDAAPEEEKPRLLQAARFGLAALENREL